MPPVVKPVHYGLNYRPDIDGLRAVAIILVVAFHLDVKLCRGGFIGVDVFFVISGFLICGIIDKNIVGRKFSQFSWRDFYIRRIRRLFPALFVFYAATTLAAILIFFPTQLMIYGRTLAASVVFSANFYFLFSGNYFAPVSDLNPLLHMWSLAVEEQFYLIFPFLAVFSFRYFFAFRAKIIWFSTVITFIVSCILVYCDRGNAFYMLPSRFWELSLGALLTIEALPLKVLRRYRQIFSFLGLGMILSAGMLYSNKIAFPGFSSLLPCIGSVLIIATGQQNDTYVAKFLSNKVMVFIGLISYSLYIWHFPFISFYKYLFGDNLTLQARLILIISAIVAALLSYYWVEKPCRYRWPNLSARSVFTLAISGGIALLCLSGFLIASHGLPQRFSREINEVLQTNSLDDSVETAQCFLYKSSTLGANCLRFEPDKQNILLFGDSHAAALKTGFEQGLPEIHLLQATAAACKPLLAPTHEPVCQNLIEEITQKFLPTHKVQAIILVANWSASDIAGLVQTVDRLKDYSDHVIVIGPAPEYSGDLPVIIANGLRFGQQDFVQKRQVEERFAIDQEMQSAFAGTGAAYISLTQALCSEKKCLTMDDFGAPIQYDYGHFTVKGAELLANRLKPQLMKALAQSPDSRH